ncbi:uncharacterized protein [Asterias amurensis]|uniref:uncharacterized protein isoform X1 n=1 Tax=Asterias amurensis TaxID=7602 RepID=UPI003AB565F1
MNKKLYVGNIPFDCNSEQMRGLFEQFGKVTECDVLGKYGFVHMATDSEAQTAVSNLDSYNFMGSALNVKFSTGNSNKFGGGVKRKIYVGNLPADCTEERLLEEFEKYGEVAECDVIRNYGFIHMKTEDGATKAVKHLHNMDFFGNNITVKFSTSGVHKAPGVGSQGECFKCGNRGHLSRDCTEWGPGERSRSRGGQRGGMGRGGSSRGNGAYPSPRQSSGRYNGYGGADSYDPYYDYPAPPPRRPPPSDEYYSRRYADDYYSRRPAPRDYPPREREYPREYALRARSRSPPPSYRRRLSPGSEYDRYYERLPPRDPYYDLPPRREREGVARLPSYTNGKAKQEYSGDFTEDVVTF